MGFPNAQNNPDAAIPVWLAPGPSGAGTGAKSYPFIAAGAAGGDPTVVKNAAGTVYGYDLVNTTSSFVYVKFYDKATTPTNADTPLRVCALPPNSGMIKSAGYGLVFTVGISFRITTGQANNDNTPVAAGSVTMNVDYS